ncbi:MAG: DUF1326 domain-containing protein, partial [Methylobacter sp.]|nr:DUF1326 domain-containing protein [Methylobacter sp.]
LVAWHIEKGQLNNQRLDDLNVAMACYTNPNKFLIKSY